MQQLNAFKINMSLIYDYSHLRMLGHRNAQLYSIPSRSQPEELALPGMFLQSRTQRVADSKHVGMHGRGSAGTVCGSSLNEEMHLSE